MDKPRMWWAGEERGWIIDVRTGLTPGEVKRCIDFTMKVQADRFISLLPGDRKDECARTIVALREFKVTQNLVGTGDHVLMEAHR